MERRAPKYQYHFKKQFGYVDRRAGASSTVKGAMALESAATAGKRAQPLRDVTNTRQGPRAKVHEMHRAGPYRSFTISDLDLSPIAPLSTVASLAASCQSSARPSKHPMDALSRAEARFRPVKLSPLPDRAGRVADAQELSVCSGEHFVNPMEWLTATDELGHSGSLSPSSSSEPPPLLSFEPTPLLSAAEAPCLTWTQTQTPPQTRAQAQNISARSPDGTPLLSSLMLKRISGHRRRLRFWVRVEKNKLPPSERDGQDLVF